MLHRETGTRLAVVALLASIALQPVLGQESTADPVAGSAQSDPRVRISVSRAADIVPAGGRMVEVQSSRPAMPSDKSSSDAAAPVVSLRGLLPRAIPLSGSWITSRFGRRLNPVTGSWSLHRGVDLAAPYGTPVFATSDGRVSRAGVAGGYGIVVILNHGAGIETRYAHLSGAAVGPGNAVREGQIIGFVGSTGRSTGPHLHYEIRRGSNALDPELVWGR